MQIHFQAPAQLALTLWSVAAWRVQIESLSPIHKVTCDWEWEWEQHRGSGVKVERASVRKEADGWRVVKRETSFREEAGRESDWNLSITNHLSLWVCSSMNSDWQRGQVFHKPTHTHMRTRAHTHAAHTSIVRHFMLWHLNRIKVLSIKNKQN